MLKPELQAKFLQHLNNRKHKKEAGFTLIELLVVIIIIGILAAIALPSLLGQVNKAKQAEAKNYVGTVNRSQQAYYVENLNFASSLSQLSVGIKEQTNNFSYTINANNTYSLFNAQAIQSALRSYYGLVGTTTGNYGTSEALTLAIACESLTPTTAAESVSGFMAICDPTSNGGYSSLSQ